MKRHPLAGLAIFATLALVLAAPSGSFAASQVNSHKRHHKKRTEQVASGTVTSVDQASMTVATSSGDATFVATGGLEEEWGIDPFTGVNVGDTVQVVYHVSSAQDVADAVIDDSSYGGY
jgi:ribosomal protein S1